MRVFKYTILLANALLIACGDDDNPIDGSRDHTGNTDSYRRGKLTTAQEHDGEDHAIGNAESHWRGIEIRDESRCSPYDRSDYRYSQSVEDGIIEELGGIYSPYTGECFSSKQETEIEHIVALSEAHDSGLCEPIPNIMQIRRDFASDPLNLTLASPALNGSDKKHYDGAEWMPPMNKCWFAQRIVEVRQKYGLTIDRPEAEALERILSACSSVEMEFIDCASATPSAKDSDALNEYDVDGDGRISCAEAEHHGIAPVCSSHPVYPFIDEEDDDGIACDDEYSYPLEYDDDGDGRISCAEVRNHGIAPVCSSHPVYPYMDDDDRNGIVCDDDNADTFTEADSCSAEALNEYDDNGNGRITCAEARSHGIAPVHRGHPAYPCMDDRDNDGVVCE